MLSDRKPTDKGTKLHQVVRENAKIIDGLTRTIIDSSSKILLVITDGKMVYGNNAAIRAMGYSQKELQGLAFDELFVPPHADSSSKGLLNKIVSHKNQKQRLEVTLHTKGGSIQWYTARVTRCYWKQKQSLLLALDDTSFSYNASDAPVLPEDNYRNALRAARHSVWYFNFSTSESFVSPEFFEALGYKAHSCEPTVEGWRRLLQPESKEEFQKLIYSSQQTKNFPPYWEFRAHGSNGHLRWFASVAKVTDWDISGYPIRVMGVFMDITDIKRWQTEKDEHFGFYQELVSSLQEGLVFFDEKGIVTEWNPTAESLTGIKRSYAVGKYIGDIGVFIPSLQASSPFQLASIKDIFNSTIFSGSNPYEGKTLESCLRLPNGEIRTIHKTLSVIKTPSGLRFALTIKDVTHTHQNLQKLEKSEERLRLAMAAGKVGVWDIDLVSGENYFSPMAFNILGYMPWEVEPTLEMLKEHIHPDDFYNYEKTIQPFLISGTSLVAELRLRKKNGDYAWILSKNRLLRDNFGRALRITGTITDITERKNTELELLQSQAELRRNIRQHEVLSEISFLFGTNRTLASKCNKLLETLGRFTNASRVYIFENDWDKKITVNTYEWCNEGIEPQIQNLQEEPLEAILEWSEGKEFFMSNNLAAEPPPLMAKGFIEQGIQSFLIFPIQIEGHLFGYIGFDERTHARVWEKAEIELLKTIANIISFAFEREAGLKYFRLNEQNYKDLTNHLAEAVFEITADGQIVFANSAALGLLGLTQTVLEKGVWLWNLISPNSLIAVREAIRELRASNETKSIELALSGKEPPHTALLKPKMIEDGSINFSVLAFLNKSK